MDNQEIAKLIIERVGGRENIQSVAHCATRLRIITVDKDKINSDAVEDIDKVKGTFFNAGQYQIILGTGLVNKVFDEVQAQLGASGGAAANAPVKKQGNGFQRAIRVFGDVFVPIIPVLVATGLFMGLRGLFTQEPFLAMFGLTPDTLSPHFITFTQVLTDTAFAFLPALVCWSTFRIFGGNPVMGIVIGLMLVNPALPNAYEVGQQVAEPLMFFGWLPVVGYQGSVLPAFITGIVASKIQKWLETKIPDSLDLILTPFLTLLAGCSLALFIIGPIFHQIEIYILEAVEWLLQLPGGLGGLLYGSFGQLLGIFGVHHILNFLEISMLATTGWNLLNPIGTCGNMAQAGAVLAVAIKSKNNKMKQIAYPSALSATLGITEPAVFGVTLPLIKPFVMSMIGGACGGFLASILGLKATGMALTGIPGTLLYLNEQLPWYIVTNLVALAVSFVLTFTIGYKDKDPDPAIDGGGVPGSESSAAGAAPAVVIADGVCEPLSVGAPVAGNAIPSEDVPDETFAAGILGRGVGIEPNDGTIVAPFEGEVTTVADTGHAVGMTSLDGIEVLIHLGVDTVDMNGDGFTTHVKEGEKVKAGHKLVTFDRKKIAAANHPDVVVVLVTNADDFSKLTVHTGPCNVLQPVIDVE